MKTALSSVSFSTILGYYSFDDSSETESDKSLNKADSNSETNVSGENYNQNDRALKDNIPGINATSTTNSDK
ncbi:MAG: hypothetical protein K0S53_2456 [Bacteroidetes bacterium]|jgi:hypothetical protein|nr:hypothetical protein [Bacteroidota bacterium]